MYSSLGEPMQDLFEGPVKIAYAEKQPASLEVDINGTNCSAFIEYIDRPVSVVIAGAGNDIQPLVEIAAMLGWLVTVVDGRFNYALTERFPKAFKRVVQQGAGYSFTDKNRQPDCFFAHEP